MVDDIVKRLRAKCWFDTNYQRRKCFAAADEIELLRSEIERLTRERDELRDCNYELQNVTQKICVDKIVKDREAAERKVVVLREALTKAEKGLSAGCGRYAEKTITGSEVPGDEQFPWVREMQVARDSARAALAETEKN